MRLLWIILYTILITGCAKTTTDYPSKQRPAYSWQQRQAHLSQINQFSINGKIAIQSKRDSGSASVSWQERAGQYLISLSGPLGSNSMKLSGRVGSVTLQMSNGKTYRAQSAEQLLATQWGYQLPVSNLKYWIRGLPVPGFPASTYFDDENHLADLSQQGFRISYADYKTYHGVDLPTRLVLNSNTLRIKIVIYDWQIA